MKSFSSPLLVLGSPQRIRETLEVEDVYLQGRRVFEEQLEWVKQVCFLEP
jgi:hypothetical protein